ncbi:MAG: thioesterase family protein, partial [Solirubrobacterales bacterium]
FSANFGPQMGALFWIPGGELMGVWPAAGEFLQSIGKWFYDLYDQALAEGGAVMRETITEGEGGRGRLWYLRSFHEMVVLPLLALMAVGAVLCARDKGTRGRMLVVVIVLYFSMTILMGSKDHRLYLPILPVMATLVGRGFAALSGTGRVRFVLTALVRTSGDTTGHSHDVTSLPTDKMPDDVEPFRFSGPGSEMFTFWDHVERRPVLKISNSTSRDPICREWFRFHPTAKFKDPFLDAARPLMMLDTFGYRAARQKYPDHTLFAPNLDTSAWFHDIEAQTDWMLIEHTNPVARDGVMFVDGRVWSESGKLVAGGSAQLLQLERN